MNIIETFKGTFSELKATRWTKPKDLLILLVYTLVTCGIIALIILGIDFLLFQLRGLIL